jgi:two-component system chemotaxis sensor kinase CheA
MMIFEPGFSNADQVTEVSGRGVGMDVVKRATESIGGNLSVSTTLGFGTTIKLSLPSSMAVKGALLFELNQQEYAVALSYTEAVVSFTKSDIHKVSNGLMASYLGKTISIIFLNDLYDIDGLKDLSEKSTLHNTFDQTKPAEKLDVLVASYGNRYVGFVVDKLLQQKEIVEKTLAPPIDQLDMISGATILGNGNVCLVLDIANIINTLFKEKTLI